MYTLPPGCFYSVIDDTPQEPGCKRALIIEAVYAVHEPDKCLLYYILGQRLIAHDQIGRAQGTDLIRSHQQFKTVDVSGFEPRNCFSLVQKAIPAL